MGNTKSVLLSIYLFIIVTGTVILTDCSYKDKQERVKEPESPI